MITEFEGTDQLAGTHGWKMYILLCQNDGRFWEPMWSQFHHEVPEKRIEHAKLMCEQRQRPVQLIEVDPATMTMRNVFCADWRE